MIRLLGERGFLSIILQMMRKLMSNLWTGSLHESGCRVKFDSTDSIGKHRTVFGIAGTFTQVHIPQAVRCSVGDKRGVDKDGRKIAEIGRIDLRQVK